MKHPRQKDDAHLIFLRALPCIVCKNNTATEAAHIRMGRLGMGKRPTGMGEKPDDKWALPLCGSHHREQHSVGEKLFWSWHMPNGMVFAKALALWTASGDHELGEQIVREP